MDVSLFSFLIVVLALLAVILFMGIEMSRRLKTAKAKLESAENVQFFVVLLAMSRVREAFSRIPFLRGCSLSHSIGGQIQQMFIKSVTAEIKELRFWASYYKELPSLLSGVFYNEVPKELEIEDFVKLVVATFVQETSQNKLVEGVSDFEFFKEVMEGFIESAPAFDRLSDVKTKRDLLINMFFQDLSGLSNITRDDQIVIKGKLIEFARQIFPL